MNDVTAPKSPFGAITADLEVSMDDVVSAFVAKYEHNLFARKKELQALVRSIDKEDEVNRKGALEAVSGKEFEVENIEPFNLRSKVDSTEIDWRPDRKRVIFTLCIKARDSEYRGHYNKIDVKRTKPLPERFVTVHTDIEARMSEARSELSEVLEQIKGISRKEREVRGRIAIRKLEDSGYANLMEDAELAQLVQL